MCVHGYVVMPEHVHLLLSEPEHGTLAEAIHYLKLPFTKRLQHRREVSPNDGRTLRQAEGTCTSGSFWQKRYYDRNVRTRREFTIKLR
jgi:putative transposase